MGLSTEMLNVLESEIVRKTLSLEALNALNTIKEKSALLEKEHESLTKQLSEKGIDLRDSENECKQLRTKLEEEIAISNKLREENDTLKMIKLEKEYNTKRGDELKEIMMTLLRNPIKNKDILENEVSTRVTETES